MVYSKLNKILHCILLNLVRYGCNTIYLEMEQNRHFQMMDEQC